MSHSHRYTLHARLFSLLLMSQNKVKSDTNKIHFAIKKNINPWSDIGLKYTVVHHTWGGRSLEILSFKLFIEITSSVLNNYIGHIERKGLMRQRRCNKIKELGGGIGKGTDETKEM